MAFSTTNLSGRQKCFYASNFQYFYSQIFVLIYQINPWNLKIDTFYTFFILGCLLVSCDDSKPTNNMLKDPHSYANIHELQVSHLDWVANVNFEKKSIDATAKLTIEQLDSSCTTLVLDSKDLSVRSITNENNEALAYTIGARDEILGAPITISLAPKTKIVVIDYQTSEKAEALQWLSSRQTADNVLPFLFTQSQAILARSWIPIQDSPSVRFTYSAHVEVPGDMMALMSANNPTERNESGIYNFEMSQPIPAYLMALVVGHIQYQSFSERCGIYAESSMLQKSADEFSDLERMISCAEQLYGGYRWGKYDLIVLPPSFPFGGMENPKLTFVTPTILAGDKSLTSLVAHELAHSWSGNLVTNATWDDFWLNEGFTVYFEHRIMESLYGREYSEMLAQLSLDGLKEELEVMAVDDTKLKLNLSGRNPDDGMTAVAYDKGYFFLRSVEELVGREKFDGFVKTYFDHYAFKSITTEEFVKVLNEQLFDANQITGGRELIDDWIYESGLPITCPKPVSSKFDNVDCALKVWIESKQASSLKEQFDSDNWSTQEWLYFLNKLPERMDGNALAKLDKQFGFTQTGNSEIFATWAKISINNQYDTCKEAIEHFLINTGRRKFLVPLYQIMISTPEGKDWALEIYAKARSNYHHVATSTLDELINQ